MSHQTSICSNCAAPVPNGEACVVCFFQDALEAPPEALPPDADTRHFALLGRLELPFEFAGHRLDKELACGGMGAVYAAEQLNLKRVVALKLVRSPAFARVEEVQRFKMEAETVARLDHPHIVPVYEVGEWGGQPYFTMKLLPGGSLSDRLKFGPIPAREAAQMMAKLARAVHHAHQRGVLHRDLKPGNVLLDAAGEPCLTDFGVAKLSGAESGLTLSSAHLGTPQYMSPEQAAGKSREVTAESDVWSLGAMLYQMLSGRVPFPGKHHAEIFRKVAEDEPERLLTRENQKLEIPQDLVTLVYRCLEKDPSRRLPSALFLAEELELWMAGEPIQSRRISPLERIGRWMRKYPGRVALLLTLALSIVGGTVTSLVLWRQAEQNATAARAARDSAAEDAYYATVANALHERGRFDFAAARDLLRHIPPARRDFEWKLVNWLAHGDEEWSISLSGAAPAALAMEPKSDMPTLLTKDRQLHQLDLKAQKFASVGTVPSVDAKLQQGGFQGLRQLTFAPDGNHYSVFDGGVMMVVEHPSGKLLHTHDVLGGQAVWLDSDRVLSAPSSLWGVHKEDASGKVYSIKANKLHDLPTHGLMSPLALSPDGKRAAWFRRLQGCIGLMTCSVDQLPEAAEDVPVQGVTGQAASGLAFSPDGSKIAVAWTPGVISQTIVYELASGKALNAQVTSPLTRVQYAPATNLLVMRAPRPWFSVFNTSLPLPAISTYDDANTGRGAFFDAERIVEPPGRLLTRSVQSNRINMLFGHEADPVDFLCLPDGAGFLSIAADQTLRRWPLAATISNTHRFDNLINSHQYYHPIASPSGRFVLAWDTAHNAVLRDFNQVKPISLPKPQRGLACFDDGRILCRDQMKLEFICSQLSNGGLQELWRVPCQPSIQSFDQISHATQTPDGRFVAVLMPGRLIVVDMETHKVQETPDQFMDFASTPGQTATISRDGKLVAVTGFIGRHVRIYEANNILGGHQILVPGVPTNSHDTASGFSEDGRKLYVGNEDGWVRVMDMANRKEIPLAAWKAHTTAITALAVSPNGQIIATAAEGSMALWSAEIRSGEPRRQRLRISQDQARNWLHFAEDGCALLHCAPSCAVERWEAR